MEATERLQEGEFVAAELRRFRAGAADNGQGWTRGLREAALERFLERGLPTTKEEDWKYTNVSPLARTPFRPARREESRVAAERLASLGLAWIAENRLVCINGHFAPELSFSEQVPGGVKVASLRTILSRERELGERFLAQYADYQTHPFVALNTAFMQDGVFILIPKGTVLTKPIHLVFLTTRAEHPLVSYPRNLIVLEEHSQAAIVETYGSPEQGVYLTNAVTEVVLGDDAVLDHTKLERESRNAYHFATLQVHQGRGTNFFSHLISTGGSLVRNEVNTVLAGEGAECTLHGLFIGDGTQHVDNRTRIDHVEPHCSSRELYKGILDGASQGVFNGKIYVHPRAVKTDARQTNKNLLLSKDATINTKPQLEIYNNDVKCTHGSTIGQLDAQALFYLRARGLGEEQARSLLTYAFASEIVADVKIERVRLQLENWLLARFREQGSAEARA
ncbi:MAG TPA: Fe-S cluster assembly protein SufD [Candidatus Acidoferrales bacterium]|nr:Fe-S cluster assembly protein SufD [Candidatus Acidoferrales bacterium]